MIPQPQSALNCQKRRQCAWNQQKVVKVIKQKRIVDVRLDDPSINGIENTRRQKEFVLKIPKCFHNNAMINSPKPSATAIFKIKVIIIV